MIIQQEIEQSDYLGKIQDFYNKNQKILKQEVINLVDINLIKAGVSPNSLLDIGFNYKTGEIEILPSNQNEDVVISPNWNELFHNMEPALTEFEGDDITMLAKQIVNIDIPAKIQSLVKYEWNLSTKGEHIPLIEPFDYQDMDDYRGMVFLNQLHASRLTWLHNSDTYRENLARLILDDSVVSGLDRHLQDLLYEDELQGEINSDLELFTIVKFVRSVLNTVYDPNEYKKYILTLSKIFDSISHMIRYALTTEGLSLTESLREVIEILSADKNLWPEISEPFNPNFIIELDSGHRKIRKMYFDFIAQVDPKFAKYLKKMYK